MKLFNAKSLAARLGLGFGAVLLLLIGIAGLSLLRMQALSSALEDITVRNAARAQTINVMKRSVVDYVQALGDLGSTDLQGGPAVLAQIQAALDQYQKAQTTLAPL